MSPDRSTVGCFLRHIVAGVGCCAAIAAQQEPSPPDPPRATSGYDGGFFLRSADGRQELVVEGLLQTHARFFESGHPDRDSEFFLRRFRLELAGRLHRVYRFRIEPEFLEDGVELAEAWVGFQGEGSPTRLMIGRMKEPFSLEEMSSTRRQDFVEKSIFNQLVPAEDHGITLLGRALDRRLEWGLAVYNGTGGDELNSDKDVAARLVWHLTDRLQVGAAATFGRAREDVSGQELLTETRSPFAEFAPGSAIDGDVLRHGAELAWFCGPAALKAEYIHLEQDMVGSVGSVARVHLRGFYASATWLVTGEAKTWDTVRPAAPFLPESDAVGTGAVELALRFSELDLDDDLETRGLLTGSPGRVRTFDLGVNWYLTEHARVLLHLVRTEYGDRITRGGWSRSRENALLMQFQLSF